MLPYLGEKPAIFPLVLNSDRLLWGGGVAVVNVYVLLIQLWFIHFS